MLEQNFLILIPICEDRKLSLLHRKQKDRNLTTQSEARLLNRLVKVEQQDSLRVVVNGHVVLCD